MKSFKVVTTYLILISFLLPQLPCGAVEKAPTDMIPEKLSDLVDRSTLPILQRLKANAMEAMEINSAELQNRIEFLEKTDGEKRPTALPAPAWEHLEPILRLNHIIGQEKVRLFLLEAEISKLSPEHRINELHYQVQKILDLSKKLPTAVSEGSGQINEELVTYRQGSGSGDSYVAELRSALERTLLLISQNDKPKVATFIHTSALFGPLAFIATLLFYVIFKTSDAHHHLTNLGLALYVPFLVMFVMAGLPVGPISTTTLAIKAKAKYEKHRRQVRRESLRLMGDGVYQNFENTRHIETLYGQATAAFCEQSLLAPLTVVPLRLDNLNTLVDTATENAVTDGESLESAHSLAQEALLKER